jgi:hypothetical protein
MNPNSPRVKHDWAFKIYQDKHCTGKSTEFAGIGSSTCHSSVSNRGAKGFFKGQIQSACSVNLYQDDHCGHGNKLDGIRSNIDDKCRRVSGR